MAMIFAEISFVIQSLALPAYSRILDLDEKVRGLFASPDLDTLRPAIVPPSSLGTFDSALHPPVSYFTFLDSPHSPSSCLLLAGTDRASG
jgi:hypothetical protein